MKHLPEQDAQVFKAIQLERKRQQDKIELIASENFVSEAVMEAQGSVLTNKYAEGYPGKRYYGGCEHVDVVEDIARDRAFLNGSPTAATCTLVDLLTMNIVKMTSTSNQFRIMHERILLTGAGCRCHRA